MMTKPIQICTALLAIVALAACVLMPGKFTSTLDIRKDRSFTFTYKGEVVAYDFGKDLKGFGKPSTGDEDAKEEDASYTKIAAKSDDDADEEGDDNEAKMQAIADALSKEQGYRSVRYAGNGKFEIDYAISGTLDHGFVYPFNSEAQAVFPFIAVELLKDGKVRMRAPGFGSGNDKPGGGMGGGSETKNREGTFTLTTDAEIVSQNQKDGATDSPKGKKIVWTITPLTRTAPMAVLKFED